MSRKKSTILNIITSVARIMVNSLLAIVVSQQILIHYGSSINGVVATATQIVLMLQVLEGGFTTATLVALYRPFVEKDYTELNCILSSTAAAFRKIAFIALLAGTAISVVYPLFLKTEMPYPKRVVVFGLIVLTSVLNFAFFQTRQIIFAVAQKEYVTQTTGMICTTISQLLMFLLLYLDLDILWLRAGVAVMLALNGIWICILARRKFPFLQIDRTLPRREIKGTGDVVFGNIAAILYRAIPMFMIATFFGAVEASIYSVYSMLFTVVASVLYAIVISPKSALGQIWHDKNISKERFCILFYSFEFVIFALATGVYATCAISVIPFIKLYTAKLPDSAFYLNYFYVAFFCLSSLILIVHSIADLLLQISGRFKIIKIAQSLRMLIMFCFGCCGAFFFGVEGMMCGLILASVTLTIYEVTYVHKIILEQSLFSFVLRAFVLLVVGCATGYAEYLLCPPLQTWISVFLFGGCAVLINLAIVGAVAFLVMPASSRGYLLDRLRDMLSKMKNWKAGLI